MDDSTGCACSLCGRRYGDAFGFPDLVVSDELWATIVPPGAHWLLCPSCMCHRAHAVGVIGKATFRSGPFCEDAAPNPSPPPDDDRERRIEEMRGTMLDQGMALDSVREAVALMRSAPAPATLAPPTDALRDHAKWLVDYWNKRGKPGDFNLTIDGRIIEELAAALAAPAAPPKADGDAKLRELRAWIVTMARVNEKQRSYEESVTPLSVIAEIDRMLGGQP